MTAASALRSAFRSLRAWSLGLLFACASAAAPTASAAASRPHPVATHHKHAHSHAKGHHAKSTSHRRAGKHANQGVARLHPAAKPDVAPDSELVGGTIRRGCALARARPEQLLADIGVSDPQFLEIFLRDAPEALAPDGDCVPFALTATRSGEVKALGLHVVAHEGLGDRLYLFSRPIPGGAVQMQTEDLAATTRDVATVTTSLPEVVSRAPRLQAALPQEVLVGVTSLVPLLHTPSGDAADDAYLVRVRYDAASAPDWAPDSARLQSVEIVARDSGRVLTEALWVERKGMPGGFFAPDGSSYEHALWTTPVSFTRISRGIGSFRITIRHKVARRSGHKTRTVMTRSTRRGTHVGVDFAAPIGTPVVSVADGTVIDRGMRGGYGNLIVIEHAGGYTTRYAHLSAFASDLEVGSEVRRGSEIGYVGSTGFSTGPHLHFEIRRDGTYLDPMDAQRTFGLWSMRPADYLPMLRQSLITDATDRAAQADGGQVSLDQPISGLHAAPSGEFQNAGLADDARAGNR